MYKIYKSPDVLMTSTKNRFFLICLLFFVHGVMSSQDRGSFSGAFETNANIFLRDSSINAINLPQYDHQFFGGEAWYNLNYTLKDLVIGARFDIFTNSNLANPTGSYSGIGLGRWFIKKSIDKLELNAGYLYDQIGSGIIFRAFENRPLFIDNALYGVSAKYHVNDDLNISAFVGKQKNAFDIYSGNIKGLRIEGFKLLGKEENPIALAPGLGFVNRTLSDEIMTGVVNVLRTYQDEDRFSPLHNSYAATLYNTLNYKDLSLYTEFAFKSQDIMNDPFAIKTEVVGTSLGKLVQRQGNVLYASLSYSPGKLSLTGDVKRTEYFGFRVDPNLTILRGLVNFLQPLNRQNTYRLTARYSPAAQEISEMAYSFDVRYKFNKKLNINVNFSDISTLEGDRLFQEIYTELIYKFKSKLQLISGIQFVTYNQEVYEMKAAVPLVKTVVPYFDILYKLNPTQAIRFEMQYMNTKQDFGSWIFGLLEYSIAPKFSFEVSGMYNNQPLKANAKGVIEKTLYPTLGMSFFHNAQRYSLRYVKQVEGIVCSGGICRLEPAFSGVRFSMSTTF